MLGLSLVVRKSSLAPQPATGPRAPLTEHLREIPGAVGGDSHRSDPRRNARPPPPARGPGAGGGSASLRERPIGFAVTGGSSGPPAAARRSASRTRPRAPAA